MKVKFLIALLSFSVTVVYSQINILESFNGDFENGINNWRFFDVPGNSGSYIATTTDAVSGNYAMEVNFATDYGDVVDRGFDNWTSGVPVINGEIYTLKAFIKGDINSTVQLTKANITFGFFNADGNMIFQSKRDVPLTENYVEITLVTQAPSKAVSCWVAFRLFDATDPCAAIRRMYIDDVRILEPYAVSVNSPFTEDLESLNLHNYPNPFHNKTIISYNLLKRSRVTLEIFDLFGREISKLLDNEDQSVGSHEIGWVPAHLDDGIYFYRFEILSDSGEKLVVNRKMVRKK